jgi:hypothetical protein
LHRSGIQDQLAGGSDVLLDRLREFKSGIGGLDPSTSTPMGSNYLSTAVTEDGESKELVPKTRIRLEFARMPNKNEGRAARVRRPEGVRRLQPDGHRRRHF